ncbi:MAG: dehydrogenase, partial [Phaeodactylibacter sp.]|nr:dehydrogenase [Phaeodactylibacter sp.]
MQKDQPSKMKRREFVKKTGLAASGLAIAPSILSAKAYAEGSDTIKVGLIGCGGRGTGAALQAMSVSESVQLVAMADAFKDRLESSYKRLQQELPNYEIDAERMNVPEAHRFDGFDGYKK